MTKKTSTKKPAPTKMYATQKGVNRYGPHKGYGPDTLALWLKEWIGRSFQSGDHIYKVIAISDDEIIRVLVETEDGRQHMIGFQSVIGAWPLTTSLK